MSELLKLSAFDAEDLDVVSTHMQDALVRVGRVLEAAIGTDDRGGRHQRFLTR